MQLQLPSHLDARARTTLKDIMSHRERHHGSSLHNDTAPQRKSLINTYTKSQSQFNRTEMGCAPRGCKDHSLPNKKTITQTHTQTHRHTHKSLQHHRNHKHTGVTLRKVTHRSITLTSKETHRYGRHSYPCHHIFLTQTEVRIPRLPVCYARGQSHRRRVGQGRAQRLVRAGRGGQTTPRYCHPHTQETEAGMAWAQTGGWTPSPHGRSLHRSRELGPERIRGQRPGTDPRL